MPDKIIFQGQLPVIGITRIINRLTLILNTKKQKIFKSKPESIKKRGKLFRKNITSKNYWICQ